VDIVRDITSLGGLAATHELLARGWTGYGLSYLVRHGIAIRVRQGWYALPGTDPTLLEAWRVGGRLTCVSGARALGLWAPADSTLHINVPPHDARMRRPGDSRVRLRASDDVRIHWRSAHSGSRYLVSPEDCLLDLAVCQPLEFILALADSALREGLTTSGRLQKVMREMTAEARAVLQHVDRRSESLPESVLRARLIAARIRFRVQVEIGADRVDFLLGERLVIEVDGKEFHADDRWFERDRARDARLSALGYRVLRFSYTQVVYRWSEVEAAIRAALLRGDHL